MNLMQILLLLLVFVAVAGLVLGLSRMLLPDVTQDRLSRYSDEAPGAEGAASRSFEVLAELVRPLGKLASPEEGFEKSSLKRQFVHAGLRDPRAPTVFFGVKTILTLGLPLVSYLALGATNSLPVGNNLPATLALLAAAGYYGPNLYLNRLVKTRQRELFEAFPDALDLLTICVEAGLGTEQAFVRVADDIEMKSVVLSDELKLVNLELRAGSDRERALRNLAFRTGVDEIDSFVTMLIQAERFGTSVGGALRVQSDLLRTRRRQQAEETAAKIGTKLLFPLMLCIFPPLFIVLLGPSMLNMSKLLGS